MWGFERGRGRWRWYSTETAWRKVKDYLLCATKNYIWWCLLFFIFHHKKVLKIWKNLLFQLKNSFYCWDVQFLVVLFFPKVEKWNNHNVIWLYVIIMSRTRFRVNLHSIVCLNVKELSARSREQGVT